jgi:hypothetical protein
MALIAICALLVAVFVWFHRASLELQMMRAEAMARAERARAEALLAVAESARFRDQANEIIRRSKDKPVKGTADTALVRGTGPEDQAGGSSLWASLSASRVVLEPAQAEVLAVEFALVNDTNAALDPELTASRILVNGTAIDESEPILAPGLLDENARSLAPGQTLRFVSTLGPRLRAPGVYRVVWQGKRFRSPEIVFRVVGPK